MYRRVEKLNTDSLRNFCINNRFYTHGDCVAYDNMFRVARKYRGGVEILEQVAEDIYDHSGYDELERFCCNCDKEDLTEILMGEIYKKCVTVSFKYES